jgi:hypothetical protein
MTTFIHSLTSNQFARATACRQSLPVIRPRLILGVLHGLPAYAAAIKQSFGVDKCKISRMNEEL